MKFIEKTQKFHYLLELIKAGDTGTAKELSEKICVSPRTLRRYFEFLRAEGYSISYCTLRKSYYLIC